MAKSDDAAAARAAQEAADDETRNEETRVAAQQIEDEAGAAEVRERAAERAAVLKSVPEGALAPTEKQTRGGETAYQREWLIANAQNMVGRDGHVVVGALHGDTREYLTVKEVQKAIQDWEQNWVVNIDPNDSEEAA